MNAVRGLFDTTLLGSTLEQWATAVLVTVAVAAGLRIVVGVFVRRFSSLAEKTANTIDDLAAHILQQTRFFALLAAGALAGHRFVHLSEAADFWVNAAILTLFLLQVGLWANTLVADLVQRYLRLEEKDAREQAASAAALTLLAKLALWSVIVIVGLQNMGFQVTGLVTSMGIAGVAVALAAQTVLADLFGSISIMFDKPFVVGDFIVVGDYKGTVENIGIKTTRLRSLTGEQLVIGNNDLLGSRIRNYKQMNERRGGFSVGVTYETPRGKLERIPAIIREAVEAEEQARFDRAHLASFGDSALVFEVVYWMTVPEYDVFMDTLQRINFRLLERFEVEGIEFAYPTRTVHLAGSGARPAAAPQL